MAPSRSNMGPTVADCCTIGAPARDTRQYTRYWALLAMSLVCWVLNEGFGYGSIGKMLSLIQSGIVFVLLSFRRMRMAFLCHMVFMLCALEFPRDLMSRPQLYTYRTFEVGGVSLSTVVLIVLLTVMIMSSGFSAMRSRAVLFVVVPFFISSLVGLVSILWGDGNWQFFAADLQYYLILVAGSVTGSTLLSRNELMVHDLGEVLLSVLSARMLVVFFGNVLGYRYGNYGGLGIFSFDALDFLYPTLFAAFLTSWSRMQRVVLGLSAVLGVVNNTLFQASGKGLLFLPVTALLLGVSALKRPSKSLFLLMSITVVLFVVILNPTTNWRDYAVLRSVKLREVFSLLTLRSLTGLSETATSASVRVYESLNIADSYVRQPLYIPLGRGLGGFFSDTRLPISWADTSAYSQAELDTRRFYAVHDSVNNVLLKFGASGLLAWALELLLQVMSLAHDHDGDLATLRFAFILCWGFFIGYSLKIAFIIGILFVAVQRAVRRDSGRANVVGPNRKRRIQGDTQKGMLSFVYTSSR